MIQMTVCCKAWCRRPRTALAPCGWRCHSPIASRGGEEESWRDFGLLLTSSPLPLLSPSAVIFLIFFMHEVILVIVWCYNVPRWLPPGGASTSRSMHTRVVKVILGVFAFLPTEEYGVLSLPAV